MKEEEAYRRGKNEGLELAAKACLNLTLMTVTAKDPGDTKVEAIMQKVVNWQLGREYAAAIRALKEQA